MIDVNLVPSVFEDVTGFNTVVHVLQFIPVCYT